MKGFRRGEDEGDQPTQHHQTSQQRKDWILQMMEQIADRPGNSVKHRKKIIIGQQRLQKVIWRF